MVTLKGSLDRWARLAKQDIPLTTMLVQGCRVEISPITIIRFLYGTSTDITWAPLTLELD